MLLRFPYKVVCLQLCICFGITTPAQQYHFNYLTIHNGLPSDYVMQIYFDKAGIMWIGTDKGLCRYDGAAAYTLSTDNGLATNLLLSILEDNHGIIWAGGSESGLARIELTGGIPRVTRIIRHPLTIWSITQDESGIYWIKTSTGHMATIWRTVDPDKEWEVVAKLQTVTAADVNANGVLYYVPHLTTLAAIRNIKTKAIDDVTKKDTPLLRASRSKIALFNLSRTRIYNPDGSFYDVNMPESSNGIGRSGHYLSDGSRDIFYRTRSGNLVFDQGKFKYRLSTHVSGTHDFFFAIASDAYHRLFLSHFGKGILQWRSPYILKYDFEDKIGRIRQTANGIVFNTGSNIYTYQYKDEKDIRVFPNYSGVQLIASDEFGLPMIGANDSLHFISQKKYADPHKRMIDISDAIYFDSAYYVSSYSNGLHRISHFRPDTNWITPLTGPGLERLKVFDNEIYITTLSKGLFVINPATRHVKNFNQQSGVISNAVYDVYKEKDTVWIGSNGGITKVYNGKAIRLDEHAGFIGKRVTCVFRDQQKRLWVLSDNILHLLLNNKLFAIRSHPILTNETSYINTAYYDDRVDKLWVGTNEHLLQVNLGSIQPDTESYPLITGNIFAGDKLITAAKKSLELNSDVEKLEVHFINPHISLYSRPAMYYRLKGYNKNWEPLNQQQVITFRQLPPGKYALETKTVGPDLGFHINSNQLLIRVLQPWYYRPWFVVSCILLLIVSGFYISRIISKRKYHAQIRQLQARQEIELERMRISRELHDNVGSMLTVVINKLEDNPVHSDAEHQKIISVARQTLAQLRDTIWALDKQNISMQEWTQKTQQFLQQASSQKINTITQFSFPPDHTLTPIKALHLFRIVQEAYINAIKHSQAANVEFTGNISNGMYELRIVDDGKGFDIEKIKKGHGLKNMSRRAQEIGGDLKVESKEGKGSCITLTWPV